MKIPLLLRHLPFLFSCRFANKFAKFGFQTATNAKTFKNTS